MTTDVETGKLKNCIENAHEEPVYKLLCLDTNKIVTGIFFSYFCVFEMWFSNDKLARFDFRQITQQMM